ncbi:hypothetical protein HDU93_008845 [Gonapodya sp. JEL0774]|nr:hypothetical protein HDU93_008845 [Gonapodya sp. JEL0774]
MSVTHPRPYHSQLHIATARSLLVRLLAQSHNSDVERDVHAATVTRFADVILRRPLGGSKEETKKGAEIEAVWKKEQLLLELARMLAKVGRIEDAYDRIESVLLLHPYSSNPHLHGLAGTLARELYLREIRAASTRPSSQRAAFATTSGGGFANDWSSSQSRWDHSQQWQAQSQTSGSGPVGPATGSQDPYARLASSVAGGGDTRLGSGSGSASSSAPPSSQLHRSWLGDGPSLSYTPLTQDDTVVEPRSGPTNLVLIESAVARSRRVKCEDHLKKAVEWADEMGVMGGAWVEALIELYYLTDRTEQVLALLETRHARNPRDPLILRLLLRHITNYPTTPPPPSDRLLSLSLSLAIVDPLAPASLSIRLAVRLLRERLPPDPTRDRATALIAVAEHIVAWLDMCLAGGSEEDVAVWAWRELGEVVGEARALDSSSDRHLWPSRAVWWAQFHIPTLLPSSEGSTRPSPTVLLYCALVHAMAFPLVYARLTRVHAALSAALETEELDELEVEVGLERCGVTVGDLFGENVRKAERRRIRPKVKLGLQGGPTLRFLHPELGARAKFATEKQDTLTAVDVAGDEDTAEDSDEVVEES